jgi:hypothetical protein
MRTFSNRSLALLVGLLIAASSPHLLAHHALPSPDDATASVTLTGKVTQVVWRSPHVFIRLSVPAGRNSAANWVVETLNPQGLAKVGVDAATLSPGDVISVRAHVARDVRNYAVSEAMTLPTGRVVSVRVGTGMNR